MGDDYKEYTAGQRPKENDIRELSVQVINQIEAFPSFEERGGIGGLRMIPLKDAERREIAKELKEGVAKLLSAKCKTVDESRHTLLIRLDANVNFVFVPSLSGGQVPCGIVSAEVFILDSKAKQVVWHLKEVKGVGRTGTDAVGHMAEYVLKKELEPIFGKLGREKS